MTQRPTERCKATIDWMLHVLNIVLTICLRIAFGKEPTVDFGNPLNLQISQLSASRSILHKSEQSVGCVHKIIIISESNIILGQCDSVFDVIFFKQCNIKQLTDSVFVIS